MTNAQRVTRRQAIGLSVAGAVAPFSPAGAQRRPSGEGRAPARKPPLLGVYVGNSTQGVRKFERWLGREVDGVLGYTGKRDWDELRNTAWFTDFWSELDRPVFWSVPLLPDNARGALAEAAKGVHNAAYREAARALATHRPQDKEVFIRTGWEFNGNWFPWAAEGREQAFIGAFRHFVDSFRSVSNRFRYEWTPNMGGSKVDPERCYPGDAHVDLIGMDFYWNTKYWPDDPIAAWNGMVADSRGLQWHQDFAAARGKPTAYSEWGVATDNAAPFIERAKAWFDSNNVVYQTYWDSDAVFEGKLSGGRLPRAASAYVRLFSRDRPRRLG